MGFPRLERPAPPYILFTYNPLDNPNKPDEGIFVSRYDKIMAARAERKAGGTVEQPPPIQMLTMVNTLGVTGINLTAQQYTAEFEVFMSWRDPEFTAWKRGDLDGTVGAWNPEQQHELYRMSQTSWHPNVKVLNQVGELERLESWYFTKEDTITLKVRLKGTFSESYELQDFPFDVQNLTLQLQATYDQEICVFVSELAKKDALSVYGCGHQATNFIRHEGFILDEWILGDQTASRHLLSNKHDSASGTQYSRIQVSSYVERIYNYYAINVLSIMGVVVSLSGSVSAIAPEYAADRLSLLLTLLLTCVAFKLAVADKLPALPYMTMLDLYCYGGIVTLSLNIVHVVVVGPAYLNNSDDELVLIWLGIWWVYNIIFVIQARRRRSKALRCRQKGVGDTDMRDQDMTYDETSPMYVCMGRRAERTAAATATKDGKATNKAVINNPLDDPDADDGDDDGGGDDGDERKPDETPKAAKGLLE